MFIEEHTAKRLLAKHGLAVPAGRAVTSADAAVKVAATLRSPVVLKAQVPAGRRGKAGLIRFADDAAETKRIAGQLLGSTVDSVVVEEVLVEEKVPIGREFYAAVTTDPSCRSPLLLFSAAGGMDVEARHAESPGQTLVRPLNIRRSLDLDTALKLLRDAQLEDSLRPGLARTFVKLWNVYRELDAELVEVNPLALTTAGDMVAVDCKLLIDDSATSRHPNLPPARISGTALERRAKAKGLLYIELDGDVGLLANGAGLTMATMDAISFYGGRPANFMEIGGDAYKKAAAALALVLSNPRVKSLLVNLCGAFARTDVMVNSLIAAWHELQVQIPLAISIHGTGEDAAISMVRQQLGIEPHEEMDGAVQDAIRLARAAR